MIKVGDIVVWAQANNDLKGKVVRIVKPGEPIHKILKEIGYKPRTHTVNKAKSSDRVICIDEKGNWYSPLKSNVYKAKK